MKNLDKLDRRILSELDHNSRQTVSNLARKLRQGRDRVGYRVDQLSKRGVIEGFTTSVNIYPLGYTIFKSYLRLESSRESSQALEIYLRNHPRIYWYALCDGSWDLMIAVFARNAREFHLIHSEIVTRFNDIVLNFSMYTLIELHMYRMGFLLGKGSGYSLMGGEPGSETIDKQDYQILKVLSDDSTKSLAQIADQLHTTPAIVRYRIRRLEKKRIITGYRIEASLEKLEMMFFKAQLYLRNYTSTLREDFREYCQENPYITCYIEQLGDATLEIELQVHDYEQFNEIIDEIRGSFSKLVRNFQTVLIRKARYNWLPRDLVMQEA